MPNKEAGQSTGADNSGHNSLKNKLDQFSSTWFILLHYILAEKFYDVVLGPDNRHVGIFPEGEENLDIQEGARRMVKLMLEKLEIGEVEEDELRQKILDLGCGVGGPAYYMAELGHNVSAVNISGKQLKTAEERRSSHDLPQGASVDFYHQDARTVSHLFKPGTFDKVFILEAIFHVDEAGRRKFLEEAYKVTKPGALLALTDTEFDPNASALERNSVAAAFAVSKFMPKEKYRQMLDETGWELAEIIDLREDTARMVDAIRNLIESEPGVVLEAYGPLLGQALLKLLDKAWGKLDEVYGEEMGYYMVKARRKSDTQVIS